MVLVGKHLILERQEGPTGIDQVDAAEPVLLGDLLRPSVFLDRHGEQRAPLHRRIVRDEHERHPANDADARDDAGAGRLVVVLTPPAERRELEEGRSVVDDVIDAIARQELPTTRVPLPRDGTTGAVLDDPVLTLPESPRGVALRFVIRHEDGTGSVKSADERAHAPSRSHRGAAGRLAVPPGRATARGVWAIWTSCTCALVLNREATYFSCVVGRIRPAMPRADPGLRPR